MSGLDADCTPPARTTVRDPDQWHGDSYEAVSVTELREHCHQQPVCPPTGQGAAAAAVPQRVLLTGATGFVGAFVLRELLWARPDIHVVCLVRAAGPESARQRVQRTADRFGVFLTPGMWSRTRCEPGDLRQERLGMPVERYLMHAQQTDTVYHCAAAVNWVDTYKALAPATVAGTRAVLSFAADQSTKQVHYVSSLAVFPFDAQPKSETDSLDHGRPLLGGYAQAKWVAERLVAASGSAGLPTAIYRPSIVTGHSRTGVFNETSYFENLIRGCLKLGALPGCGGFIDIVPVDYVAAAMVRLSLSLPADGQVYHLNNPRPLSMSQFAAWLRQRGYPVSVSPFERWKHAASEDMRLGRSALYPFRRHLERATPEHLSIPAHRCARTTAALSAAGIECPSVGGDLLTVYFQRFEDTGFLEEL